MLSTRARSTAQQRHTPATERQFQLRSPVVKRSTATAAQEPCSEVSASSPNTRLRRLILLRHADSETSSNVRDHDRPLSAEGILQATSIANKLREAGWVPDLVLASNSKRTKQTIDQLAEVIEGLGDVDSHYYGSLYTVAALDGQTKDHICECLLEVADDARTWCILCVGHNKGWEEAATAFAGQVVKLQSASAALLQCAATSWKDVLACNPQAGSAASSSSRGVELPISMPMAAAAWSADGTECGADGAARAAAVGVWQLVDVMTPHTPHAPGTLPLTAAPQC